VQQAQVIVLACRPAGVPKGSDFNLETRTLPSLEEGELRVRNTWLSVDPSMRVRMTGVRTYVDAYELSEPLEGGAVGEVAESRSGDFKPGDKVLHMQGWRSHGQGPAAEFTRIPEMGVPEQRFLGVLGVPGMTAWVGLNRIAQLQDGESVLVSAASGAVGSLACQLAMARGCKVVGTTGSREKCEWLGQMGVIPINYQIVDNLGEALAAACPDGFDVYFENVGGPLLEAVLNNMREHGRLAFCGLIDAYNSSRPEPGPRNLQQLIMRRLRLEGFVVNDHWEHYPRFLQEMGPQVAAGTVEARETVIEGIEHMAAAFIGLFTGQNVGKMLVKL
jgi:NADPH-dependent curcumin reductase CurA